MNDIACSSVIYGCSRFPWDAPPASAELRAPADGASLAVGTAACR